MEAEINAFTRKSKKYRTKYFYQLDKLYGEATKINLVDKVTRLDEVNPIPQGISIKSNIT